MKKIGKLLPLIGVVLLVVLAYFGAKSSNSNTTPFCGRKLVNVPEWLDISEPEGGLSPGATASGLLAVRAHEYLRDHREIKTFEIKEVILGKEKPFLTYEDFYLESADNGGARISLSQALLDDNVAETARNIKRSRGNEREAEVIYESLANEDSPTAWHFWYTKGKKSTLHATPETDEYWSAWSKDGILLQANYGGFVYIAGREDPVCVAANSIVKIEDNNYHMYSLSKNLSESYERRYVVYGGGLVARENPNNGEMEVCPWYADRVEWVGGNSYYPKLPMGGLCCDAFVFVPNEDSFHHNKKSILASGIGFELMEYDQWSKQWYVRCKLSGAGNSFAIYGDEINLVATSHGLFVIDQSSISLIRDVSAIENGDEIVAYDKSAAIPLAYKWNANWRGYMYAVEDIKTGYLLGHRAEKILEFDESNPAKLNFPAEADVTIYTTRNGDMNAEYFEREQHSEVDINIGNLKIKWSLQKY